MGIYSIRRKNSRIAQNANISCLTDLFRDYVQDASMSMLKETNVKIVDGL